MRLTEKLGYAGSRLFSTALERCAEMSSVINKRTLYDHLGGGSIQLPPCSTALLLLDAPGLHEGVAPSSKPLRGSPAARSSAPMSIRDTAAATPQTRVASSCQGKNAACLAASNASSDDAPRSRR